MHRVGTGTWVKLHLLLNLVVIEVLFRWFYGYLLILGIFPFFGGVIT